MHIILGALKQEPMTAALQEMVKYISEIIMVKKDLAKDSKQTQDLKVLCDNIAVQFGKREMKRELNYQNVSKYKVCFLL